MARAIRIEKTGGPEVMKLAEVEVPKPGQGQALVRVEATGVNFIDIYQRSGAYKLDLPLTLGQEGAGVVEAVGPGVTEVRQGQRSPDRRDGLVRDAFPRSAARLVAVPTEFPRRSPRP
jgi:NADPH2:quinone reductase